MISASAKERGKMGEIGRGHERKRDFFTTRSLCSLESTEDTEEEGFSFLSLCSLWPLWLEIFLSLFRARARVRARSLLFSSLPIAIIPLEW